MNYQIIKSNDYLMHYGVKGMKWGVRRYEKVRAKQRRYQKKADNSRNRLTRRYYESRAVGYKTSADNRAAALKETKITRKAQQRFGIEASARAKKNLSSIATKRAARSKTKLGKRLNENAAYNTKKLSEAYTKTANQSKSTVARSYHNIGNVWTTPYKTITGRETTRGREYVKGVIIGIAGNVAMEEVKRRKGYNTGYGFISY